MLLDLQQFGSVGMSSPQLAVVVEDDGTVSSRDTSDSEKHSDVLPEIAPEVLDFQKENKDGAGVDEKEETPVSSTESTKPSSLGQSQVAENDDGFRTPTSADHRIPMITECPPAPKKIRPSPSTKRKVSQRLRRCLQPDLPSEDELILASTTQDDVCSNIKKARRDDYHDSD